MNEFFNAEELQEEQDIKDQLEAEWAFQQSLNEQEELLNEEEKKEYLVIRSAQELSNVANSGAISDLLEHLNEHDPKIYDAMYAHFVKYYRNIIGE